MPSVPFTFLPDMVAGVMGFGRLSSLSIGAVRTVTAPARARIATVMTVIWQNRCGSKAQCFAKQQFDHSAKSTICRNLLFILLLSAISGLIFAAIFYYSTFRFYRHLDESLIDYIHVSQKAETLPKSGSLFCWVMTASNYHDTRAKAINETWLNKCDHGQLFTNDLMSDESIPYSTVFAGIPNSYNNLFYKTRYAFHYIYTNVSSNFDWYIKADDDTYLIVEHLREYLAQLDPNKPYYLGYVLRPYLSHGYNGGGAGYVLSREALRLFNEYAYDNETICPHDIYEDVGMGRCLANLGIYPSDTRNDKGQNRFNTYMPSDVFFNRFKDSGYLAFPEHGGFHAFANDLISFHHLSPDEIRLFHVLLYTVRTPKTNSNQPDPSFDE